MMKESPSDAEVIQEVLQGDVDRFEILLDRYKRYVFTIVGRRVPYEHVDEIAHETFIQAYSSLSKFRGDGEFKDWIASIAVRATYAFWRKQYKNREVSMGALGDHHKRWVQEIVNRTSIESFDRMVDRKEAKELLQWALGKLTPEERAVLELTVLEGRSVKETAALLGWSPVNVKVRAFRARSKLKKLIEKVVT